MALRSVLVCVRCRSMLASRKFSHFASEAYFARISKTVSCLWGCELSFCNNKHFCCFQRRSVPGSVLCHLPCSKEDVPRCVWHVQCRLLNLFASNRTSKKRQYSERRIIGYTMDELYEIVSCVEAYNTFVPYCTGSTVLARRTGFLKARMAIGFGPVQEQYISSVTLARPHLVRSECTEGRLFNHLLAVWKFAPGPTEGDSEARSRTRRRSCVLDFSVSFEFRSQLHSKLSNLFFDEVARRMVSAFLEEARRRYGPPDAVKLPSSGHRA